MRCEPRRGFLEGAKFMFDQVIGWIEKLTKAGVSLLALGIIMQVIFGKAVPFIGGDIIGNITAIIGTLGAQGVVGLASVGVIYAIFNRK
jgi:hypothetical protein